MYFVEKKHCTFWKVEVSKTFLIAALQILFAFLLEFYYKHVCTQNSSKSWWCIHLLDGSLCLNNCWWMFKVTTLTFTKHSGIYFKTLTIVWPYKGTIRRTYKTLLTCLCLMVKSTNFIFRLSAVHFAVSISCLSNIVNKS